MSLAGLAAAGPCDMYASGGTPCVAAHSTTRALYNTYDGPLYQVKRASDNTTINVVPVRAGGVANATRQDLFCKSTSCVITIIHDQSGRGNNLSRAPKGAFPASGPGGADLLAHAAAAPVTVDGHKAYGVFIPPGVGYRNNKANGTATGDGAEGMYAVLDGTHYNDKCCFDYGNAEVSSTDTGNGHMEAIHFGNGSSKGAGPGPWITADLENGVFSGMIVCPPEVGSGLTPCHM
jgi:non-reducing end alpha-L-arabinofuranosidase